MIPPLHWMALLLAPDPASYQRHRRRRRRLLRRCSTWNHIKAYKILTSGAADIQTVSSCAVLIGAKNVCQFALKTITSDLIRTQAITTHYVTCSLYDRGMRGELTLNTDFFTIFSFPALYTCHGSPRPHSHAPQTTYLYLWGLLLRAGGKREKGRVEER